MLRPPEIWPSVRTPPAEVEPLKDLYANLWGVHYNVEAWRSALQLFQFCKGKPHGVASAVARSWGFIAANDCVHQLHHLRERLALIKGHKIRVCPSLSTEIDTQLLRVATRKLDEYFPDIDAMRHAVAHSGANDVVPQNHAPPNGWLLTRLDDSGRYSTHYQERERSLEITGESLRRIEEVAAQFLSGFAKAAQTLAQQGYTDAR